MLGPDSILYRYTTRYGKRINGLRVFANNTRTLIQVYSSSSSMYIITVYYHGQQFALSFSLFSIFDFLGFRPLTFHFLLNRAQKLELELEVLSYLSIINTSIISYKWLFSLPGIQYLLFLQQYINMLIFLIIYHHIYQV